MGLMTNLVYLNISAVGQQNDYRKSDSDTRTRSKQRGGAVNKVMVVSREAVTQVVVQKARCESWDQVLSCNEIG